MGTSDRLARAAAPVLTPNKVEGQFAIVVTASKDGSAGRAEIRESNTLAGGQMMKQGGGPGTALKIILAAASVGGGIAALAARGGGSKSGGTTGAAATPTTLSVGTVTVGGPR